MAPNFVKHRVNRAAELSAVDPAWGVEIDLRSSPARPGHLHLSHDPWSEGESFESWLAAFKARAIRGPIILNTKEDGLEERTRDLLARQALTNFFFLDTALPTLVRWTGQGLKHFAVRLSSMEPVASLEAFAGKADWIWVDCFGGKPLPAPLVAPLRGRFKICLVSPELQGQPLERLPDFRELAGISDLICTKDPASWTRVLA